MADLTRKFKHSIWFKGAEMTVRDFIDYAARYSSGFDLKKRIAKKQSDNLMEPVRYDFVITCEGSTAFYRVSSAEAEYFQQVRTSSREKLCRI